MARALPGQRRAVITLLFACTAVQQARATDLAVRVFLLSSDSVSALDSGYKDNAAGVEQLFQEANVLWSQADVRWNLTSVSVEPARFEQAFQEQVLDEVATPAVLLAPVNETVFPTDSLFQNSSGVFNVVFVKDLGAWGWSVYNHRASALLHAESPSGGAPGFSESTRLAQGLGRMLSLGYTGCYQHPSSLMSTDCDGVDNANLKGLDSCQLSAAMAQAEANAPWSRGGNAACPCVGCGYNYNTVMALGISTVAAVFLVGLVVISYACHARRKRGRMADMDENEEDEDGGFGMGSSRFFASQGSMRDVGSVDDLRDGEGKKDK